MGPRAGSSEDPEPPPLAIVAIAFTSANATAIGAASIATITSICYYSY